MTPKHIQDSWKANKEKSMLKDLVLMTVLERYIQCSTIVLLFGKKILLYIPTKMEKSWRLEWCKIK